MELVQEFIAEFEYKRRPTRLTEGDGDGDAPAALAEGDGDDDDDDDGGYDYAPAA
ncbi:hypothetical protein ACJRO7_014214 [Eucalyptus globulus]|uniref:Uncharacterized protein n=1 Tax=Eucalyptus globulus TaxID=34317 RepID=A0ABD3KZE3_EUCGL